LNTAVLARQVAAPVRRRITVPAVRAALEDVVAEHPGRVDRRSVDELPNRYIDQGKPSCLVALVLVQLGFSHGVLKALDQEHPPGDVYQPGVRVADSRHPALKRCRREALLLLQYVQSRQDRGDEWGRIVTDAFKRNTWICRRDEKRRPWLYS
jgi:hypothetical protein